MRLCLCERECKNLQNLKSHFWKTNMGLFQECEHLQNSPQCVKQTDSRLSHSVKTCKILSNSVACVTKGILWDFRWCHAFKVLSLRLSHWSLVLLAPWGSSWLCIFIWTELPLYLHSKEAGSNIFWRQNPFLKCSKVRLMFPVFVACVCVCVSGCVHAFMHVCLKT